MTVDRLVQSLNIKSRRGVLGGSGHGSSRSRPKVLLEALHGSHTGIEGRRVGHRIAHLHGRIGVLPQEIEGLGPFGLDQQLSPQICGPDGIGLVHEQVPADLVAGHGHRQTEGQQKPDQTQQGPLDDPQGFPLVLGVCSASQTPSEDNAESDERPDDNRDDQDENFGIGLEQHTATVVPGVLSPGPIPPAMIRSPAGYCDLVEPEGRDTSVSYYRPGDSECRIDYCELTVGESAASCAGCNALFPVSHGIVEFVLEKTLDEAKRRELMGNTLDLDQATIDHYLRKVDWEWLVGVWSRRKARRLSRRLHRSRATDPAFLGAGTGFEVPLVYEAGFRADRLVISDLSATALRIARRRIDDLLTATNHAWNPDISWCTSDLDAVPLRSRSHDIVVFECLHHTPDMHASLERMLAFGYRSVHLVEPTANWVIRLLARRGLAQRVEYSGVEPDRLSVRRVRSLARRYGYTRRITTSWELPVDYTAALARRTRLPRWLCDRIVLAVCDVATVLGRPFHFGNFSVVSLVRRT